LSCEATTRGSAPSSSAFLHTARPICLCLRRRRQFRTGGDSGPAAIQGTCRAGRWRALCSCLHDPHPAS
jgi:hypothetical protein